MIGEVAGCGHEVFRLTINPFTTGNPYFETKLLGFSIGRGSGL